MSRTKGGVVGICNFHEGSEYVFVPFNADCYVARSPNITALAKGLENIGVTRVSFNVEKVPEETDLKLSPIDIRDFILFVNAWH
jgi:hypothetical protein